MAAIAPSAGSPAGELAFVRCGQAQLGQDEVPRIDARGGYQAERSRSRSDAVRDRSVRESATCPPSAWEDLRRRFLDAIDVEPSGEIRLCGLDRRPDRRSDFELLADGVPIPRHEEFGSTVRKWPCCCAPESPTMVSGSSSARTPRRLAT